MLSYALAIAVALSSLVLFLTAFLMSDIHRKDDFLWSAVGLIYALVLWFCARNITGAVLLGQASASILLISFVWQTLKLRKAVANPEKAIAIGNFSVLQAVNGLLKRNKKQPQVVATSPANESPDVVTESDISIPETASDEADSNIPQKEKTSKTKPFGKIFGQKNQAKVSDSKPEKALDKPEIAEPIKISEREDLQPQTTPQSDRNSIEFADKPAEQELEPKIADDKLDNIANTVDSATKKEAIVKPAKPAESVIPIIEKEPEAIAKPDSETIEDAVTDKIDVEITVEVKSESQVNPSQPKIVSPSQENIKQDLVTQPEAVEIKTDSESEIIPVDKPEIQVIKSKAKESSLDSLETVEVAEILEALPENSSGEKDDRSNIIEVTTTEIEEVSEVKSDENSSSDTKD